MKRYSYYLPDIVIVISNALYDISANAFPLVLNPQAGLTAYYMIAAVVSLLLFFCSSENKNFPLELHKMNWSTFTLALGCTSIDLGYVLLFRAGWNISLGGMVCNILLAVCMLLVGRFLFGEKVSCLQFLGVVLCIGGLIIINRANNKKDLQKDEDPKLESI